MRGELDEQCRFQKTATTKKRTRKRGCVLNLRDPYRKTNFFSSSGEADSLAAC